ncbi:hypothetical protein DFJ43DRAFT_1091148 [Lentinula guzmanii]|uniref:Uncharacterized protein n=1 Tax=Lentinula guzmanii TaxID=2804957 RepID=A0AA38MS70_9AGAR|nr:hypothetical protein DFJ43DRAFT_1091148 [Lentinula guzmanii]
MYDHELQDNRRPQSSTSTSQPNPPSNSPKLNFSYDNGNNAKLVSHLPALSGHPGLPLQSSHPVQARPSHPTSTSTPRPGSRPSSSASVTSTPSITSISPPLASTVALNHNPRLHPAGAAPSVVPTRSPPTDYSSAYGSTSRPHPSHQDYLTSQYQDQNITTDIPANTPQTPHTSSGIPVAGRSAQYPTNGPPPPSAPTAVVGPTNGNAAKHLPKSSNSSVSLNGFPNMSTLSYASTQHRRASGSAVHTTRNGATASPKSTNISPVFLHRVPPSIAGSSFSGVVPSVGQSVNPGGPGPVGHATHFHMSPRQIHRAPPIPSSTTQLPHMHTHQTPSTSYVPTPPIPTPKPSLHLVPYFTSTHSLQTTTNSASAATAQTVTQAILATTQRSLEHTWNTILTSVDSEVTKLHAVHAGQIRVWAEYVESVKKESESTKARIEGLQRDADRIRKEREIYRAKSKDLENQIVKYRNRIETQNRLEDERDEPAVVVQLQRELEEMRRKFDIPRYQSHAPSSSTVNEASNELVDRLRKERDDLKVQVANLVAETHLTNHPRPHSDQLQTIQKLQNELLSLSTSHKKLLNAQTHLQSNHDALRVEHEDLSEREQKARIKLGIAEEALKGEKERTFELDEARKREKKSRKEMEREVEGLKTKLVELEQHLAETSSGHSRRKEFPGEEHSKDPELEDVTNIRPHSRQFQHEPETSTPDIQLLSQQRSPHGLSRHDDVVDVDAHDIILSLSPAPTGPSVLSPQPHSRPLSRTSLSHRGELDPVANTPSSMSPTPRHLSQLDGKSRRSRSVVDLSGPPHHDPDSEPRVTRMDPYRTASKSPSMHMHDMSSKGPSPDPKALSPSMRETSPISMSIPHPPDESSPSLLPLISHAQVPAEPTTVTAPVARRDKAFRRSFFTEYRPLSRSNHANQKWHEEADSFRPLSRSELHLYQRNPPVQHEFESPTSTGGVSLEYGSDHVPVVAAVTTTSPQVSSISQASIPHSRPTSPLYMHDLARPSSAARSSRPSSKSGFAESSKIGRVGITVPRLNIGVLDRIPASNGIINNDPGPISSLSSSPVATLSPSSNSLLVRTQRKPEHQSETAIKEVGEIEESEENQEDEEGEEPEKIRDSNDIQRPDPLHRISSPSPFTLTHNDDSHRSSVHARHNSFSTSSHSWLATSVEHRRTFAQSPSTAPHLPSVHDESLNHSVGRNGVNHLKRKGIGIDERDYSQSVPLLHSRDVAYSHSYHPHPHPHKLAKVLRDGHIVASPVDLDGYHEELRERKIEGRMEGSGGISNPTSHTPTYTYPSVKTQDFSSSTDGKHRSPQPSSPPQTAVPMSISPVSPSSPATLAPFHYQSESEPRVEHSARNQDHILHAGSDSRPNTRPNLRRVLNTPLETHLVQPYSGLPMKPLSVDSVLQPYPGLPKKPSFEPVDSFQHGGIYDKARTFPGRSGSEGWYSSVMDTNGSTWKPWAIAPPTSDGNGQDQPSQNSSGTSLAPIKQLSFKHIDLLYETIGGEYICRECRASSTTNMTKPKSFPTSSPSFTEIFGHYSEAHKAKEEEVLKFSPVKLQEQLVLLKGGGSNLHINSGRGGKKKIGGKKGIK